MSQVSTFAAKLAQLRSAAGWPAVTGFAAALLGLALLVAGWWMLHAHTGRLAALNESGTRTSESEGISLARTEDRLVALPEDATHTEDWAQVFKLAKSKGVAIRAVEYQREPASSLPVVVRTLAIHIAEDYPKVKGFLGGLLAAHPHASVTEITMDRKDASTSHGEVLLKVMFVYRAPDPGKAER